jgi:hypothetical protein
MATYQNIHHSSFHPYKNDYHSIQKTSFHAYGKPKQVEAPVDCGCFDSLVKRVKEIFSPLTFWISQLFGSSDPALMAKWDVVVEKDTEANCRVLADGFVKAVSKTGVSPSFSKVLVINRDKTAGALFYYNGYYTRLAEKAEEFNNPKTLVIIGFNKKLNLKDEYQEASAKAICNFSRSMSKATIFMLNGGETEALENGRMSLSLLHLLKK